MPIMTAPEQFETFGKRVARLRKAKGLRQQDLAVLTNMTVSNVAQIERGVVKNPQLTSLRALARALDVGLAELIGEDAPEGEAAPG